MSAVNLGKLETLTIPLDVNETEFYGRAVKSYEFLKLKNASAKPKFDVTGYTIRRLF